MNSTSSVMFTSSPTSTPPVSRAEFQVRPKSFRLILVVAESPMRVLPQGSLPGALGPSTANVTGLVRPCMVRSPITAYATSPVFLTEVDLKVMVGYFSTSKKSALLRCPSRWASPVVRVDMSMEASAVERVGSVGSSLRTPLMPVRLPFTLEIIMCLTLNSAAEWAGSSFQVIREAGEAVVVAMGVGSFHFLDAAGKYSLQQVFSGNIKIRLTVRGRLGPAS